MEDGAATMATNVARAIAAGLDWSSPPDARKAAVSYLESVKAGDIRALASACFILVKKNWSSEIRLHAFKMLQHLVRLRWEELSSTERRNFANLAVELMSEVADPCEEWALKSQTAALVAEIVRREGLILWQEMLPSIISLSTSGPVQAELVSMMLRWLPEDITVHNEDLEGDRRRLLLRGLTDSLPEILPLLYTLLERHFGAAINEAGNQQLEIAKQHAATVTATLNAINAYAEWAPLPDLAKFGIIHGCGFLLSSPDFRLHACEFFKLISPRKRPVDESTSEFDSAMSSIFQMMMNVSKDCLSKSSSNPGAVDDNEFEFAEYICESIVSLGSTNLHCISGDDNLLALYLHQMLGYFMHYKLALHLQSLHFWLALMRDLLAKPKISTLASVDGSANNSSSSSGRTDNEKRRILSLINDGICDAILDVSCQRMLRKEKIPPETAFTLGPMELWSDDFEGKGEFGQFRSKLLELIRCVATHKPLIAASKVSDRVVTLIKSLISSPTPAKELPILESAQISLENVVAAIFDGFNEVGGNSSEVQISLCRTFEGLLQQLLALKWNEPVLVEVIGHYLEALGPFLKFFPGAVGSVINKLFELLTSLPYVVKDPSTNRARHARLQICSSFIRLAKSADKSLLPHMKAIADTMGCLQNEGRLLRGEHNLLGEAFLIMASAAGFQQQQEVLKWLLEPLSKPWVVQDWQTSYLSDPAGLVRLCSDTPLMWSIFHTVTFFERALKRSGVKKSNMQHSEAASPPLLHPMAPHLSWMLPPLLKLLRAIHSLWSPTVALVLPQEVKGALIISDVERTSLLGEVNHKVHKGALSFADGSLLDMNKEGYAEPNETDIRNWLKGIRDSGYNVLGLSTTIGDTFFKVLDSHTVVLALMENVMSMEFRHIKQLIHLVLIPLVKSCPSDFWDPWLVNLLQPLLPRAQQSLTYSWLSLKNEGKAKVPDVDETLAGPDLKIEVLAEKILRDFTREICALLSVMASPGQNAGIPALEHSGHVNRLDASSLKDLDAFASSSIVGFLLTHKSLAVPALQICLEAFKWTDTDALTKISSFCGTVISLCVMTRNTELREFVCRDMFYAIIQCLALKSNAIVSSDLVNLCREIFVYLADRDPAPRQILLSLPCITPQDLLAFEEALSKTLSPREQKQHLKSLLLLATGDKLEALAGQKSVNIITNISMMRPRGSSSATTTGARGDEGHGEPIGLAGMAAIM